MFTRKLDNDNFFFDTTRSGDAEDEKPEFEEVLDIKGLLDSYIQPVLS